MLGCDLGQGLCKWGTVENISEKVVEHGVDEDGLGLVGHRAELQKLGKGKSQNDPEGGLSSEVLNPEAPGLSFLLESES